MGSEAKEGHVETSGSLSTTELESLLLRTLNESEDGLIKDSWALSVSLSIPHESLVGVMKSLLADNFITADQLEYAYFELTTDGKDALENGAPEVRVFKAVPQEGIEMAQLKQQLEKDWGPVIVKVGYNGCMKNKWLRMEKADKKVYPVIQKPTDVLVGPLESLVKSHGDPKSIDNDATKLLKSRKMVTLITRKFYRIGKGENYSLTRTKLNADLTKELLDSGAWKTAKFKTYNFRTLGKDTGGGYLHPLMKVRAEFRRILMSMGFEEMPTSRYVESSFWNFDSLFQPQHHPARDAHDTFFLKEPEFCNFVPEDYYEKVKTIHEKGGHGSIGYGYEFKREEAMKNLLRTHTTAISSQMLYKLANQEGGFKPVRYFSIDRVFRNETMDATHLAEFHQVEGVVADYNLSLGDLIGTIAEFFRAVGIQKLRFKPAYNPYTEPSMEIFGYSEELGKWMEIGNSGIFRPEMLRPMNLPPKVNVIAWGLSLERPTMIKYKVSNIRDLFGHKVNLRRTKAAGVVRFP